MKKLSIYILLILVIILGIAHQTIEESSVFADKRGFDGTVILGRPTNTNITASITTNEKTELYIAYGEKSSIYTKKTDVKLSSFNEPAEFLLDGLASNKTYYYMIYFKLKGGTEYIKSDEYKFETPKNSGNSFNFVIQSDSHLLNKADKELYRQSMISMNALNPDFMFDLGDTFLLDNGGSDINNLSQEKVDEVYRQQLSYFDIVTRNAPLFLAIGNHESEYGVLLDETINNIAAKSTISRKKYYLNPISNAFYSGNKEQEPSLGNPENYYAFTWGDALFVTIDPYRYSSNGATENLKGDGWGWTLGKTQYDWFRTTLENSNAKYKFVFAHHAIGNIRGGANIVKLYEWGGYDQKGKYLFDEKRPSWGKPIHQVMKDNGVTIFFQGHDHLFAREDVDGIVYQTLPKPAEKIADKQTNYKYYSGDVLLNSGFLNINVSESGVKVDYNRNYLVASGEQTTGIVYSYIVDKDNNIKVLKNTKDILENYGKNDISNINKNDNLNKIENKIDKKNNDNKSQNGESVVTGAVTSKSMRSVPQDGFSFAVEADPHFDENYKSSLINKTALNIINSSPDFLLDLGDASMIEKLGKTIEAKAIRNSLIEDYFSKFGSIPIKMVTGNHDVEINTQKPNYYSFTKNNALFIILDPYSFTQEKVSKAGGWAMTLGKTQYDWLKNTLESSNAKFKFVFIHQLTGGIGKDSRGGAEAAEFYEWGGSNESGVDEFSKMRPGWDMPIHDLLVKNNVNIVFHGHDHFYAKQEKEGVVYQLVPQPGTPGNSVNDAYSYGYKIGTFLPSAGYIRVVVSSEEAVIEYIKTEENTAFSIPNVYSISNKK